MPAKLIVYGAAALGGAPLLIYPFVLLANVMSLAAEPSGRQPPLIARIAGKAFLWTSTAYPLLFGWCCVRSIQSLNAGRESAAVRYGAAPLAALALILVLFLLWQKTDRNGPNHE